MNKLQINAKYKAFFISIILIIISIFLYLNSKSSNYEIIENAFVNQSPNHALENNSQDNSNKIKIHIIGEVKNPGIYELNAGCRIQDAIIAAGGETELADLNKVNLAYELEDGQKINICSILDDNNNTIELISNYAGENVIISDNITDITGIRSRKININKASVEELQNINGIGPSLAEKIINYRNKNGKFEDINELKNISGLGEKKFESIKEYITLK